MSITQRASVALVVSTLGRPWFQDEEGGLAGKNLTILSRWEKTSVLLEKTICESCVGCTIKRRIEQGSQSGGCSGVQGNLTELQMKSMVIGQTCI